MDGTWILRILCSLCLACFFSCQNDKTAAPIPPKVSAVYPSSDTLPENLLRMYIHFSKPMKTIGNLENIKLIDDKGRELRGAIFNNVYELWDQDQTQLTLILDPARVKTGLQANRQMGRALQAGQDYQLLIGRLEDVDGNRSKAVYKKSFHVSTEDRLSPNTALWSLRIPKAESLSPLLIQFPQMLDQLSLLQRLQLTDQNKQPIPGKVEIKKQETLWQFTPSSEWQAGDYVLYVHARLEDPCGNNLNGLFDHKVGSLKNEREGMIERIPLSIGQ